MKYRDDLAFKVAVLMATYNGIKYLHDQVNSVQEQANVDIVLFVSDDFSSDGTWEWLKSNQNDCLMLLPREQQFRSAAKNFFYLLRSIDFSPFDYVALCDQDDVWEPNKISYSIDKLIQNQADSFSSSITAFWPDGRKKLIAKSQPQTKWDHFFQSPGPGCTYLLTATLAQDLCDYLKARDSCLSAIDFHDWFIYAFARSHGYKWHIDAKPTLYYRQHSSNVLGANQGVQAYRKRLKKIWGSWYRNQVLLTISHTSEVYPWFFTSLQRLNFLDRLILTASVNSFRRDFIGKVTLLIAFILMKK